MTGGGVSILITTNIIKKHLCSRTYSSFELTMVKIFLNNKKSLTLLCVYRLLFISVLVFLEEIVCLFESLIASNESIVLAGDVNLHMETNDIYARQFKDILDMFNIMQHIKVPTHIQGHTLDIVTTFINNPVVTDVTVNE